MSKICDVCGLPEELCVCEEIAREVQSVKVFTVRRRFGKLMTIVEGIDEHDIDIKELTKTLKAKCACGGTAKKGQIELQGEHKARVKEVLSEMGLTSTYEFTTIHNYIDTDSMILRKGAVSAQQDEILLIPINMRDGFSTRATCGSPWNVAVSHIPIRTGQ